MIGAIFDWDGVVIDSAVHPREELGDPCKGNQSNVTLGSFRKRVWQKKRNDNRVDAGLE